MAMTLVGRIYDNHGNPVNGIIVEALNSSGTVISSVQTTATGGVDGIYTHSAIADAGYRIRIKDSQNRVVNFIDGITRAEQFNAIYVGANKTFIDLNGATILGTTNIGAASNAGILRIFGSNASAAYTQIDAASTGALTITAGSGAGGSDATVTIRNNLLVNKKAGKGGIAPPALLHINTGTAAANTAPLKLSSGTNLTTAETGAIEYNGTNLFFTRTGTLRENVLVGNDAAAAPATAAIGVLLDYYGTSSTRALTTPNSWASVNISGQIYKIPLYT